MDSYLAFYDKRVFVKLPRAVLPPVTWAKSPKTGGKISFSQKALGLFLTPFLFLALGLPGFSLAAETPTTIESESRPPGYYLDTLDLDLDGGYGTIRSKANFGGRLRIGKLWAREVRFYSLGATVGDYSAMGVNGGIELEAMHLESGFWGQTGLLYSEMGPALKLSAGWALFGADVILIKEREQTVVAFMTKLRIPLRLIILAL